MGSEGKCLVFEVFKELGIIVGKDGRGLSGIAAIKLKVLVLSKRLRGYIVGSWLI